MSTTSWFRLLLVPLVAVLAASDVAGARASTPTAASGTATNTSCTLTNPRSVGNNTIFDLTCVLSWTGTLSGTSVGQGTLMINANGSGRSDAVETFTGTVSGIPGTLTIDNSAAANPAGALRATDVIVGGTGQLAGISGVLHEVGTVPPCATCFPVSTYTGELQ